MSSTKRYAAPPVVGVDPPDLYDHKAYLIRDFLEKQTSSPQAIRLRDAYFDQSIWSSVREQVTVTHADKGWPPQMVLSLLVHTKDAMSSAVSDCDSDHACYRPDIIAILCASIETRISEQSSFVGSLLYAMIKDYIRDTLFIGEGMWVDDEICVDPECPNDSLEVVLNDAIDCAATKACDAAPDANKQVLVDAFCRLEYVADLRSAFHAVELVPCYKFCQDAIVAYMLDDMRYLVQTRGD